MGTKKQFKKMIDTCRAHGVRVYTDAVINHMAGNGNDMYWDHIILLEDPVFIGDQRTEVMDLHGGLLDGNMNLIHLLDSIRD